MSYLTAASSFPRPGQSVAEGQFPRRWKRNIFDVFGRERNTPPNLQRARSALVLAKNEEDDRLAGFERNAKMGRRREM